MLIAASSRWRKVILMNIASPQSHPHKNLLFMLPVPSLGAFLIGAIPASLRQRIRQTLAPAGTITEAGSGVHDRERAEVSSGVEGLAETAFRHWMQCTHRDELASSRSRIAHLLSVLNQKEGLSEADLRYARDTVDLHERLLNSVARLVSHPDYDLEFPFKDREHYGTPFWSMLRTVSRLLCVKAHLLLRSGQHELAFDAALCALAVYKRHLASRWITHNLWVIYGEEMVRCIQNLISQSGASSKVHKRVLSRLKDLSSQVNHRVLRESDLAPVAKRGLDHGPVADRTGHLRAPHNMTAPSAGSEEPCANEFVDSYLKGWSLEDRAAQERILNSRIDFAKLALSRKVSEVKA